MVTVDNIRPFLSPDFLAGISSEYLTALCTGTWDYVQNYTNWPNTKDPPPGLLQAVAQCVTYYAQTRPHLEEMKSEDLSLVFRTVLPDSVVRLLTVYRRLRW